ncbi:hypothetical protein F0562_020102 [Nyssa sinensis]|uniref:Uncharacterized protein n=1 Tax=Nyssa sinensis TaxID=561372 RepID=A0A5J5BR14_9ASTE|nr:hypothetical protein F0562_020102 [Nyssa sinensis]
MKKLCTMAIRGNSHLHRHHRGHPPASSWSFPQVWLRCGVLDLSGADLVWLHPWYHLCCLCHHQVVINQLFMIRWRCEAHNKKYCQFICAYGEDGVLTV